MLYLCRTKDKILKLFYSTKTMDARDLFKQLTCGVNFANTKNTRKRPKVSVIFYLFILNQHIFGMSVASCTNSYGRHKKGKNRSRIR